jgi:hypothetical protein
MATLPNWANLSYHDRIKAMEGGQADVYGNTPTIQQQGSTNVSGTPVKDATGSITGWNGSGGAGSSYTVGPDGRSSYTVTPNLIGQQSQASMDQARLESDLAAKAAAQKAALANDAFQQRLALMGAYRGGASAPGVQHQGSPNEQMAQAMAFGQAKDTAGEAALGALKSLQNMMAERGMTGSTEEANAGAGILGGSARQMAGFNKDQLLAQIARQQAVNDMTYQGGITMRGQDMAAQNAMWGLLSSGLGVY